MSEIAERLTEIRERVAGACARAGRAADAAELLAVSKTFPAEVIREAVEAGQASRPLAGGEVVREMVQGLPRFAARSRWLHRSGRSLPVARLRSRR